MRRSRQPADRPLVRRDADGGERTAPSWETLTERLIREAQEAGQFDDLPGHGRRLELEDDALEGEMALAHHVLRNAGVAPPWIEVDKEVRQLLAEIDALILRAGRSRPGARARLERDLVALADRHDDAVTRLDGLAPTPRQQRPRLDRKQTLRRLRAVLEPMQENR